MTALHTDCTLIATESSVTTYIERTIRKKSCLNGLLYNS